MGQFSRIVLRQFCKKFNWNIFREQTFSLQPIDTFLEKKTGKGLFFNLNYFIKHVPQLFALAHMHTFIIRTV